MSTSYSPLPTAKDITSEQFSKYLALYKPLIQRLSNQPRRTPKFNPQPPNDLCELDRLRFDALPTILRQRQTAHGKAWLSKEELQQAMAWKLYAFLPARPSLALELLIASSQTINLPKNLTSTSPFLALMAHSAPRSPP